MKIIIDRGFTNLFTKIVVFRNANEMAVCPMKKNYCEFDAKEGDKIEIRLRYSLTLASFVCCEGKDTYYFGPTAFCRRWELLNFKIFPYLCLLLFVFQPIVKSEVYDWVCAGMVALTALSLICFQSFGLNVSRMKRLYRLDAL